jgi:hypothetical protein
MIILVNITISWTISLTEEECKQVQTWIWDIRCNSARPILGNIFRFLANKYNLFLSKTLSFRTNHQNALRVGLEEQIAVNKDS